MRGVGYARVGYARVYPPVIRPKVQQHRNAVERNARTNEVTQANECTVVHELGQAIDTVWREVGRNILQNLVHMQYSWTLGGCYQE